jgi:hypothetical protein
VSHHHTECHIIIQSVTSSYRVSHHHTECHIIIQSVTSSYRVSHHHIQCHIITRHTHDTHMTHDSLKKNLLLQPLGLLDARPCKKKKKKASVARHAGPAKPATVLLMCFYSFATVLLICWTCKACTAVLNVDAYTILKIESKCSPTNFAASVSPFPPPPPPPPPCSSIGGANGSARLSPDRIAVRVRDSMALVRVSMPLALASL